MSEWPQAPIGAVAEVFDGPHATPKTVDFGPIFLGIGALQNGRINLSETRHVTPEDFLQWTRRVKPQPGDVVFSYETRLGEAAIIPEGLECCLGRRMGLVRADLAKLDPRYFLYNYLSPEFQEFIRSRTIPGATVDRISLKEFPSFPISLPPLGVQRAIATILGALDDKIDLNRRMNETVEAMARAIFDHEGSIGVWETRSLGDICAIYDGPHATPKLTSSGPIFLGISNLNSGKLHLDNLKHVAEGDFLKWTRRVLPRHGDIVFSYETRLGEVASIPEGLRCCLGRRMGLLRAKSPAMHSEIILQAFLGGEFQETIRQRTIHGSTVERIPLREMGGFPIRLPDGRALEELATRLQPLRSLVECNQREVQTLTELRNLLLPTLMSGEIRVGYAEKITEAAADGE